MGGYIIFDVKNRALMQFQFRLFVEYMLINNPIVGFVFDLVYAVKPNDN